MKAIFILGAIKAIRFVDQSEEIESMVQQNTDIQMSTGVGYNVGVRFINSDSERPGWSSTRGAKTIWENSGDYSSEFGAEPCDNNSEPLDKL